MKGSSLALVIIFACFQRFGLANLGDMVYWVDGTGAIQRVNVDGSGKETVLPPVSQPGKRIGIAIEEQACMLYWGENKGMMRMPLDGGTPEVFADLTVTDDYPVSLWREPTDNMLYWVTLDARIYRKPLTPTHENSNSVEELTNDLSGVGSVERTTITVDSDSEPKRLYFVDKYEWKIMYQDWGDDDFSTYIEADFVIAEDPTAIFVDGPNKYLYFADTWLEDGGIFRTSYASGVPHDRDDFKFDCSNCVVSSFWVDLDGSIYIADGFNHLIKGNADGEVWSLSVSSKIESIAVMKAADLNSQCFATSTSTSTRTTSTVSTSTTSSTSTSMTGTKGTSTTTLLTDTSTSTNTNTATTTSSTNTTTTNSTTTPTTTKTTTTSATTTMTSTWTETITTTTTITITTITNTATTTSSTTSTSYSTTGSSTITTSTSTSTTTSSSLTRTSTMSTSTTTTSTLTSTDTTTFTKSTTQSTTTQTTTTSTTTTSSTSASTTSSATRSSTTTITITTTGTGTTTFTNTDTSAVEPPPSGTTVGSPPTTTVGSTEDSTTTAGYDAPVAKLSGEFVLSCPDATKDQLRIAVKRTIASWINASPDAVTVTATLSSARRLDTSAPGLGPPTWWYIKYSVVLPAEDAVFAHTSINSAISDLANVKANLIAALVDQGLNKESLEAKMVIATASKASLSSLAGSQLADVCGDDFSCPNGRSLKVAADEGVCRQVLNCTAAIETCCNQDVVPKKGDDENEASSLISAGNPLFIGGCIFCIAGLVFGIRFVIRRTRKPKPLDHLQKDVNFEDIIEVAEAEDSNDEQEGNVDEKVVRLILRELKGKWRLWDDDGMHPGLINLKKDGTCEYDGNQFEGGNLIALAEGVAREDGWILDMQHSDVNELHWLHWQEAGKCIMWKRCQEPARIMLGSSVRVMGHRDGGETKGKIVGFDGNDVLFVNTGDEEIPVSRRHLDLHGEVPAGNTRDMPSLEAIKDIRRMALLVVSMQRENTKLSHENTELRSKLRPRAFTRDASRATSSKSSQSSPRSQSDGLHETSLAQDNAQESDIDVISI